MRILSFINQYGKRGNFVKGFTETGVHYHGMYPTDALEATQENIKKFLDRYTQFDLESVEVVDGSVKWNTVKIEHKA